MANKIHKTYESFVATKDFKFEPLVIDVILNCIKDNQEYLTQPENLPQLAKLGYMYNELWYAGRVCWGSSGILRTVPLVIKDDDYVYNYGDCEDNPKYKIEMCDPANDEIENLIYDCWGMHVSDGGNSGLPFDAFRKLVLEGKELTPFEKRERKPNKTFDEWVEILTDKQFKYHSIYPDRRSVANHLLCTIGNGYGLSKNGFIIKEASGADQDEDIYGEWENAKFSPEIQSIIESIMNLPVVKSTLDANYEQIQERKREEISKKRKSMNMFYEILKKAGKYKDEEGDLEQDEVFDRLDEVDELKGKLSSRKKRATEYHAYYPISSSSKIHTICDPESRSREGIISIDPSYITASKEICFDILDHLDVEDKAHHGTNNGEYARKFLAQLGVDGFELEKGIDKYKILDDIRDCFAHVTDDLSPITSAEFNQSMYGKDNYYIYLKDTSKDSYGDNNYYCYFNWSDTNSSRFPIGLSNNVDFIKSSSYYDEFKTAIDRINVIDEVKQILFYFRNGVKTYSGDTGGVRIYMEIHTNPKTYKYAQSRLKSETEFLSKGFNLDDKTMRLNLDKVGVILQARKPEPGGVKGEYYSNALTMDVIDGTRTLFNLQVDERGFNICYCNHIPNDPNLKKMVSWMISEHAKLKASDKAYGTYDSSTRRTSDEGKKNLYVHDFMLWLKEHQNEFK